MIMEKRDILVCPFFLHRTRDITKLGGQHATRETYVHIVG